MSKSIEEQIKDIIVQYDDSSKVWKPFPNLRDNLVQLISFRQEEYQFEMEEDLCKPIYLNDNGVIINSKDKNNEYKLDIINNWLFKKTEKGHYEFKGQLDINKKKADWMNTPIDAVFKDV